MKHENKRKAGVGHRKFNALVRFWHTIWYSGIAYDIRAWCLDALCVAGIIALIFMCAMSVYGCVHFFKT